MLRENTKCLALILSFILAIGITSCSKEESVMDIDQPIANDDASLLKWQMEKRIKTRAIPYNIAVVTTKSQFEFYMLSAKSDIRIDWGDGYVDNNVLSHTYTDGEAAHTIFVYGDIEFISTAGQEVIFLDPSGASNLKWLMANGNRLTNINLSNNKILNMLELGNNKFRSVDLSSNTALDMVELYDNPLTSIDVQALPLLNRLRLMRTNVTSLDISQNPEMQELDIIKTKILNVDTKNNPKLRYFFCSDGPMNAVDFSKNPSLEWFQGYMTNITDLNFSNNPKINIIKVTNAKIDNIILPSNPEYLRSIDILNNPIEQNLRKMTTLTLSLPDCNVPLPSTGEIERGRFFTNTPYISTIESILDGYNWGINY